jgi:methyl-accepting chemotaxis protein
MKKQLVLFCLLALNITIFGIMLIGVMKTLNANHELISVLQNYNVQLEQNPSVQKLQDLVTKYQGVDQRIGNVDTYVYFMSALSLVISVAGTLTVFSRIMLPFEQVSDYIRNARKNGFPGDYRQIKNEHASEACEYIKTLMDQHALVKEKIDDFSSKLREKVSIALDATQNASKSLDKQQYEMEQVATAVNQMSSTVQEVAANTSEAADAAVTARGESSTGQAVVQETMKSIQSLADEVQVAGDVIQKLRDDSNTIGGVLDVIRGISDQTNLLALNAAIEAARAGEAGRGFAVVADEVRTLAQRTGESTEEIQNMIERLQNGAEEAVQVMDQGRKRAVSSVEQASKAGASLDTITLSVQKISDYNTQIATAAEEQSVAADGIHNNIVSISDLCNNSGQNVRSVLDNCKTLQALGEDLYNIK